MIVLKIKSSDKFNPFTFMASFKIFPKCFSLQKYF